MPVDFSGNPLPKVDQGGIPEGISPNRRTAYMQSVDDVNRKMQGGKASPFATTMRPEYDQKAHRKAKEKVRVHSVNPQMVGDQEAAEATQVITEQEALMKDQFPITAFQNNREGFLQFYGDKLQQSASQVNPEDNRDYYNILDQYGKRYILPDEYKAEFEAMQALNQAIEAYNDVESRFADKDPKLREDVMSKARARIEKAREGLINSRELSYEATDKKLRDLQRKREEIENDEGSALNAVLNLIPFGSLLSGESKEEKLAAVDQEIKRLELSKRVIDLSPTGALSAVGVEVGEDEDPAEKLERHYRTLEKAYYDLRGDYEGDLEGAVKGAVGSFFGTDDSRAFADLKMELQAIAPLVMLRRIPMGDDGAGEVFYKSFLNSFNPQLQAELEAESTQSSINRIEGALEMAGAKVSDPDVGQAMDKIASPYEHYSAKDWAQMMGPTTAMMAQITMSSPLYGGIMRATKLGKFLEAGKKTGTILGTEKGMTALGNTSVGRGVVKAVYGGLDEGIKFQTAGSVFGSDEELNFLSGFVGGLAAYPLSTLAEKGAEKTFRKHLGRMFGDKTEDAYRKIYDLGEAMKSGTKIAARGPAETFEEFGNEIGNIYRESSNWAEISKKFEERFGDMSENLHFAVSTAVMGWGFGAATNVGSVNLAKSKKHYENLTEVEKQQFRSFMEEMNGEMEEVAEGIADTVNADEEARQNQEPAQEVEPETTESTEDTSGEQDGTEEVSEDAGQDDVEADNGRVDMEEGVAEETASDETASDEGTTVNEQVDEVEPTTDQETTLEPGAEEVVEEEAVKSGEETTEESTTGFAERLAENNNSQVEDIGDIAEGQKKVKILDTEITVSEDADKITLEKIRTDEAGRGKGSATEAMDALIDEADKSGKPIELTLKPEEGTNKQRLREFYEGFGFEGEGDLMTRQPVQDENQDNIQQSEEVDEPGVQSQEEDIATEEAPTEEEVVQTLADNIGASVEFVTSEEIGDVAGVAKADGTIQLNKDKVSVNTPIHEAGHLWNRWAKENRSDLYQEGLNKLKKSNYLNGVKNDPFYQEQTKDMTPEQAEEFFLEEALAKAIGDSGERFVTEARKKGFKQWLQSLWDSISELLGIENISIEEAQNLTLGEFADRVAASILSGQELDGFVNGEFSDQYQKEQESKWSKTQRENTTFEFVRKRFTESPNMYRVQSNEETIKKAIAWIEQKQSPDHAYQALLKPETWSTLGEDIAMINVAAFILADTYAAQFEYYVETNEGFAKDNLERWEKLEEIQKTVSTNLGRAVNAYNIWKTMTPMGMAYMIDQKIKDINSGNLSKQDIEGLQELMDELAEVKGELDQAKKRIVEEVMKTKQVKDALEAIIKQRQSNVDADKSGEADTKRGDQKGSSTKATRGKKRNRAYKPADKVKEAKADFKKALDKFKNSKGTASASFAFLNNEQIEALGEMVVALTKQGYYRTQEIVDEILDQIDAESLGIDEKEVEAVVQGTITSNSEVRQEIDDNYDRITNTTAKKLGKPIEEIVKKHYNERDPLKRSLAEKISEELGLNADEAKLIADSIERLVQKSAQAYIDKYYKKKEKKPTNAREAALDVFVNSINNGVLDNDAYRAEFLKRFKMIPELTPEQIAKIKALTENMQSQEGQFYIEAMRDLVKYTEQLIPKKWFDSFMDGWMGILYGHMLSGPGTHVVNIYSVVSQILPDAIGDLVNVDQHIKRIKKNGFKSKEDLNVWTFFPDFIYRWAGAISGLLDGKATRAFKRVWKNGSFDDKWVDDISKNNRPFNVSELERGENRFIGGNLNPYNKIKYINRALSGEDSYMRASFTEAYLAEKYREILSKKLGREATLAEVAELANFDSLRESQRMAAQRMANSEARKYFEKTGRQLDKSIVKQRAQEILRAKTNKELGLTADAAEELMDNVHDAAKYSVFTGERNGAISRFGRILNRVLGSHRLVRFALMRDVPFVTIVGNVVETIMDGLPIYGLARAYGYSVTSLYEKNKVKEKRKPSARIENEIAGRRQMARAWLGTIGFAVFLAMYKLRDDDDPEDVPVLITGSATHKGDAYAKNYTYEPYTIYLRFGEGEDKTDIAFNYLNWPGINAMLNAVGEMNDRVLMDRNLPKEERTGNIESFVRAVTLDQVDMIMNMSFVQGAARFVEDVQITASEFLGQKNSPKENKEDESDIPKYIHRRLWEKYLPLLTDLGIHNSNFVKQTGKLWTQESYTRRTYDEAVAYALSSVSFRGNFRVDAMGEKIFTVPTDNFIPWNQWINDKSNDERWVLLRKAGYIPNKPQARSQTIYEGKNKMKRKMTANEEAYYNTRAGEIFSDYLTVYIRTNPDREQDRKLDVQHLDSNKKQTSLLREEIIRLHEDARKRARKETKDLIKNGTFDKYYDQMYDRLKNQ